MNLTHLDISLNKHHEIPDNIFSFFPKTIKYLSVNRNTLADFEWEQLIYLPQLEALDLSKNKLMKTIKIYRFVEGLRLEP